METRSFQEIRSTLRDTFYESRLSPAETASLLTENSLIATVLETMAGWEDEPIASLLKAYLFDNCSSSELRKLNLARNLTTVDRYWLLGAIWACSVGIFERSVKKHTRLWITVNRLEHLLQYSAKERHELVTGMEYLVEHTSCYLTLWLTVEEHQPELARAVKAALGERLLGLLGYDLTAGDG